MIKHLTYLALLLVSLLEISCEREGAQAVDPDLLSPFLRNVSITTQTINLDDSLSANCRRLPNNSFAIFDTIAIIISQPIQINDPTSATISFQVHGPNGGINQSGTFRQGGILPPHAGDIVYTAKLSFVIDRTDIGIYTVEISAINQSSLMSNVLELPLIIGRTNSAPMLGIPSAREFTPVGSDSTQITLTIPAADSNGFADIAQVFVRAHNAVDSSLHILYDNGTLANGDQALGDGIFSAILWVTPTTSLRLVTFEFTAVDHEGSVSIPVLKSLENHSPQIAYLEVPDSIQRPSSGATAIGFYEKVFDADGLADIDSVYFRNFTSVTPTNFLMYDDGNFAVHGDTTANDGVYSLIVQITPANSLGKKEFHFYAVDKLGAKAEIIKTITIY